MPDPATDAGSTSAHNVSRGVPESPYAWTRLCAALVLSAIGGVGMWSVIVVLPAVQAEFGVARSAASLPYTMTMISFGFGGILMGASRIASGSCVPVVGGAVTLGSAISRQPGHSLWQFALAQGLLVGVASSATFAPLIADTSLWFTRHRGMAVSIIASGSYLAGTVGRRSCSTSSRARAGAGRTWASPSSAWRPCCRSRWLLRRRSPLTAPAASTSARPRASSAAARDVAGRAADRAGHRRPQLLRRDVDAAGPHRRVLRRPGPRRGARARRCCR